MSQVTNKFRELLKMKELAEGRDIPLVKVEAETNITRKTLQAWRDNKIKRFDKDVIKSLCDYFDCDVGDLIEYKRQS
jgi:putative transcriptional regulator